MYQCTLKIRQDLYEPCIFAHELSGDATDPCRYPHAPGAPTPYLLKLS